MNSRSGVNESSLVNFTSDLPSLDTKDSLLGFPFDHLYACHSETSDPRDSLELSKDVSLPVPCVVREDKELGINVESNVNHLNDRLTASENQNKRLKDLLIYHLDLIQQQNELITRRDKLYQALLQENQTLKNKLHRRHGVNPPAPLPPSSSTILPLSPVVLPPPVTSSVVTEASQIMLNSFTELLLPENRTNPFLFDNELSKTKSFEKETFGIARTTTPTDPDLKPFACDTASQSVLEQTKSKYTNMRCEVYKSNDKRSLIKKESAKPEQLYTVSSNSGNPVIQKVQRKKRTTAGVGHLNRMPKNTTKIEIELSMVSEEPTFDLFGINRKNKTVNTYGKARNNTTCTATSTTTSVAKRSKFGSLSDRLQLIDTTPTGEDPYQLGEADLREQSPIPKLMLQKTNHGRMKVLDQPSRRIYDPASPEPKISKRSRFLSNTFTSDLKKEAKTMIVQEPDLDLVKTEPEIDWRIYPSKSIDEIPVEYSPSDSCGNPASSISLDCNEFQDLFTSDSALNLDDLNVATSFGTEKLNERPKRRGARVKNDISPLLQLESLGEHEELPALELQHAVSSKDSKRGRKRAMSTTGLGKGGKVVKVPPPKRPSRAKARVKKTPPPPRTTRKEYHTHVGDPDLSWYLGLDPEVKTSDIDPPTDQKSTTVEVPRWREKPFTSIDVYDGTENLDDRAFEKRHQKLEAEERRQLRWHMRRIREQRHVEKLKHRQRYSWCPTVAAPAVYTVWPRPQRDARSIEISHTLPVTAFGEPIPQLPPSDFMLPWVRTSRAQKRSKRSKTLH